MIVRSILLLAVTITFVFADDSSSSGNTVPDKRGPMGFQGMRGKKDFASSEHGQPSKRAPMGFQGMRGKKDSITGDIENELIPEETNKRAPMGFQGMRGKKDKLIPDFEDGYFTDDLYEKRVPAPTGLQSIRGKKTWLTDEYYKRAPMGFQGMRGKKSLQEILNDIERRAAFTGFQGGNNKETYLLDYPEDYEKRLLAIKYQDMRDKKDEILEEWEKRAPMGFQGMRGKKTMLDAIEELEKRAIVGFHGMRGKKDIFDNYVDYSINPSDYEKRGTDFQDTEPSESFKRARMGFHGMRGKRDAAQIYGPSSRTTIDYQGPTNDRGNELAAYEIEKRSPFRYFGVRGKKNPRWEFRGKFVGVRGKKSLPLQPRAAAF
ncbi:tachykinins [Colletes gigas]|uniref:tachykinins n=1 Tax=Colletes gigas TaxID=935657 RepID=UPI001C9BB06B|nr:tachykinins [Colletes gigas]XP_043250225.1 tachykinins [Colletes gigas]